jgi:hypothetical protein
MEFAQGPRFHWDGPVLILPWKVLMCQIKIVWVFSLPLMFDAIENHALDGCLGIEKEGHFQR